MSIRQQGGVFGRNPAFNDVEVQGQLDLDGKAVFNNQLEIYTTGTNSVVKETGAGDLYIAGENIRLTNGTFAQKYLMAYPNAQVELYHSGNLRVVTTAAGATLYGNLAVPAGNGIDFSATSGTGTSELFDDYEEGTWTPAFVGTTSGSLSFGTVAQATYCKVGNMIYANCYLTSGNLAAHNIVGSVKVSGLPYASGFGSGMVNVALSNIFLVDASDTSITGYVESSYIRLTKGSGAVSLAGTDVVSSGTSGQIMLQIVYQQ